MEGIVCNETSKRGIFHNGVFKKGESMIFPDFTKYFVNTFYEGLASNQFKNKHNYVCSSQLLQTFVFSLCLRNTK